MLRNGVFYAGSIHTSAVSIRYMFSRGVDTIYEAFSPAAHGVVWKNKDGEVMINEEQLNNFYTFDHHEKVFIFMLAPCGKCDSCRVRRNLELVSRLNYEADCHDSLPLFVTLTYSDDYLPSDGVNKVDVQKFIKRLRNYFPKNNIRYFVASEYGKLRGRPHYHLILYGLPFFNTNFDITRISNFISKAWCAPYCKREAIRQIRHGHATLDYSNQLGQIDIRVMKDRRMFSYVAKYLVKPQKVPKPYVNKPFSLRSLGLGREILNKYNLVQPFRLKPDSPIMYRSILYGDLVNFKPSSYFLKKLCPTFTQIVPVQLRNLFDAFNNIFRDLARHGYDTLKLVQYVMPYYEKYRNFGFARPCYYSPSKVGIRNSKAYILKHYQSFVLERERVIAHIGIVPAVRCLLEDYVTLIGSLRLLSARLSSVGDLQRYVADMRRIRRKYMASITSSQQSITHRSMLAKRYLCVDDKCRDNQ